MEAKSQTFPDLINGDKPVLVDFFAEWCGPCKMVPPILHELKQFFGDALTIIKVDVDKNSGLSFQYKIQGVPTLVLFQKGQVKWRQSGVIPAGQLKAILRQYV